MSPIEWRPNPGPQTEFLCSSATEALYGGAAGGGKSEALLMDALRDVRQPTYRALLLRRTYVELDRSLLEKSRIWYPIVGGQLNEAKKTWRFPSGAVIEFGHVEHETDVHSYQSAEYQFLGFDELTSFTEKQYLYLTSRGRSAHGIPVRIRAATNPGGQGHEWVLRRWAPWLDRSPKYVGRHAAPGEVVYYRNGACAEEWCAAGDAGALSRVFIPARVTDNPHLMDGDPGYADRLRGLDAVTRAQLLEGDWMARDVPGALWNRALLDELRVREAPDLTRVVVAVDPAVSANANSDSTGIVVAGLGADGRGYVLADVTCKASPDEWARRAVAAYHEWKADRIVAEVNQGGALVETVLRTVDAMIPLTTVHASRGKVTRAEPIAALYEQKKVSHVGPRFFELENQLCSFTPGTPKSPDRLDALVWGLTELMLDHQPTLPPVFGGYSGRSWGGSAHDFYRNRR